jgi:hypothetical protein
MNKPENKLDEIHQRFGQNSADSQGLVQAWSESRPEIPADHWETVWAKVVTVTDQSGPKTAGSVSGFANGWVKLAAAASVAALTWFAWPYGADHQPANDPTIVTHLKPLENQSNPTLPVSIDLIEAESFAVIRLDDAHCHPENPCLDSVESSTSESNGAALASSFSLFNDLESLATD